MMDIRSLIEDASKALNKAVGYGIAISNYRYDPSTGNHICNLAIGKYGALSWEELIPQNMPIEADVDPSPKAPPYDTITMIPWEIELIISNWLDTSDPSLSEHIAAEIWQHLQNERKEKRLREVAIELPQNAREYLLMLKSRREIQYKNYDFEIASYLGTEASNRPEFTQIELSRDHTAFRTLEMNGLARVDRFYETLVMITADGARVAEIIDSETSHKPPTPDVS